MNRDNLLSLYDKLAQLVDKLPGGLQKPILRELAPIREVFLEQRPARIMLVGSAGKSIPEFLHEIGGVKVDTGESRDGWRSYRLSAEAGRGEVLILDGRFDTPQTTVEAALAHGVPDLILYLKEGTDPSESLEAASARVAATAAEVPVVGVAFGGESARGRLAALLSADREISVRRFSVCTADNKDAIAEAICAALPNAARLEFARLVGAKKVQAEIASSLLKSFTTVCGVIGLQPIPLADMPVLTALQSLMVSLIVYVSGKQVNARLITEFLGALGISIGAGILFRESARAIIKIVPFWGNAVSGVVAGAGTYAVGRAAIAYFIEETPINETRKLFNQLLPSWDAFKRRRLPSLKKKLPFTSKKESEVNTPDEVP